MNVKSAWKERFIKLVANRNPERVAARACGVGLSYVYQEMERDDDFARRVRAARET